MLRQITFCFAGKPDFRILSCLSLLFFNLHENNYENSDVAIFYIGTSTFFVTLDGLAAESISTEQPGQKGRYSEVFFLHFVSCYLVHTS